MFLIFFKLTILIIMLFIKTLSSSSFGFTWINFYLCILLFFWFFCKNVLKLRRGDILVLQTGHTCSRSSWASLGIITFRILLSEFVEGISLAIVSVIDRALYILSINLKLQFAWFLIVLVILVAGTLGPKLTVVFEHQKLKLLIFRPWNFV